ncbi:helix-turn-helix domain-containing protein [Nonomuraea jiangxiensis]|uniref:Helix-turn-helix domain-containing protein n=1 Tax=Nonomuraea jiangxiensis TaxID=633440 RepID=A0A1G9KEU4_9ACTN|nr:helix-turn-helix transcriptional regulator [Nonomuraea jiangxiensis]SDL48004.1 Helix-turn-helix domain-containing protein [Nonomuraea jiangxiensis]
MAANGDDPSREAWKEYARRQLQYRTDQGLSQERLADRLPYSESAVGHVERLMRKPTEEYTREIEKALGLDGQLMELLPAIHGNTMGPKWFREWPRVEALAHTIRTSEPMLIPGLLQTERYAREVLLGRPGATPEEAEQAVRLRVRRQAILGTPKPPMYSTLIDENVLHRPVGGAEVMREQLQKLLDVISPPYVTVRIIPLTAGLTVGCLGAFEVATMFDGGPDHAYLESAEEGRVTNRAATVQALIVRWEALSGMAYPVDRSRQTIREVMESYG